MANVNAAFGLRPVRHITGAEFNEQGNEYEIPSSDATAYFIGDIMKLNGDSNTIDGTPQVTACGITDVPVGVIIGFKPVLTNLSQNYHLASTVQRVILADAPDLVYLIQSDGTLAHGDIGATAEHAYTLGSTVTGISGSQLHESDVGTSTHNLLILRLHNDNVNAFGANGVAEVLLNNHAYKTTPGV